MDGDPGKLLSEVFMLNKTSIQVLAETLQSFIFEATHELNVALHLLYQKFEALVSLSSGWKSPGVGVFINLFKGVISTEIS